MANGETAKSNIQLLGITLTITCFFMNLVIMIHPGWRKNDPQGDVIETIIRLQGLWYQCIFHPHGAFQCEDYDRFFIAMPQVIVGGRIFMFFALIFQFMACLCFIAGARCSVYHSDNPGLKSRLASSAGVLTVMGSFCVMIASSWYSAEVLSTYWSNTFAGNSLDSAYQDRYVYGPCLYVGWLSFVLGTLAGGLICYGTRYSDEEAEYIGELETQIKGPGDFRLAPGPVPSQAYNNPAFVNKNIPVSNTVPRSLQVYYKEEPSFTRIPHNSGQSGTTQQQQRGARDFMRQRNLDEYV